MLGSLVLLISLVFVGGLSCAQTSLSPHVVDRPYNGRRFFLEGDGRLALENMKTGERGMVVYRLPDGTYPPAVRREINEIFGLEGDPVVENISLRFVALLDYIQDQYGDGTKTIKMNSAYRAPDYNQRLRDRGGTVAKASTHMEGMAADLRIDGVDGRYLWESLRAKDCCGVGWYGGNAIHVDAADPRFWTGTTSKVRTDISENNKKILLRTDYDIYRPGETVHLELLRVTVFPFGVKRQAEWVALQDGNEKSLGFVTLQFSEESRDDCVMIHNRVEARALSVPLSGQNAASQGESYIKLEFCDKPSPEMPDSTLSNQIMIR